MLKPATPEMIKESLRFYCKTNKQFALGVIRELCATNFCLFEPSVSNDFSQMGFLFPLTTNEEFLECVLDCVELLSGTAAEFNMPDPSIATGYTLLIKSSSLIKELIFIEAEDPWCLAGILFVDLNKHKTNKDISVISDTMFKDKSLDAVNKFSYLLL